MTTPRTPVVLGLGRGAGASTVAAALHAHDGSPRDTAADVIVCAAREESLRLAETLAPGATRPWLAVVLLRPGAAPTRARLQIAARRCAGLTLLPCVEQWAGRSTPLDDLPALLGHHPEQLPLALRGYAAGLRAIAAALLRSGQLDRPAPPVVAQPVVAQPVVAQPVVAQPRSEPVTAGALFPLTVRRPAVPSPLRPVPFHSVPRSCVPARGHRDDDLDDEALELAVDLLARR